MCSAWNELSPGGSCGILHGRWHHLHTSLQTKYVTLSADQQLTRCKMSNGTSFTVAVYVMLEYPMMEKNSLKALSEGANIAEMGSDSSMSERPEYCSKPEDRSCQSPRF